MCSNVEYGEGRQQQYRAYGNNQRDRVPVYIPHQVQQSKQELVLTELFLLRAAALKGQCHEIFEFWFFS
jgi:hypothetical protein